MRKLKIGDEIMSQLECVYCENDLPHGCPNNGVLTDEMIDFGISRKFVQTVSKSNSDANSHRFPYWGSSHEYDWSLANWGKIEIKVTEFVQSGVTHYFGAPLGIADAICKVLRSPSLQFT